MPPNGGSSNESNGNRRVFDNFFGIGSGRSVSFRDVNQDNDSDQSGRRRRRSSHSPTSPTSPSARLRIDPSELEPELDNVPDTQPPDAQPPTEQEQEQDETPLTTGRIRSIMREVIAEFIPRIDSLEQRVIDLQFQNDLTREEVNTLEEVHNELGESHSALQNEMAGIQREAREQQSSTDMRFANVNEVIIELTRRIDMLEEQLNDQNTSGAPVAPPAPTTLSEHEVRAVRSNLQQSEDHYFLSTILINGYDPPNDPRRFRNDRNLSRQILMLIGCEDVVADADRVQFFNQYRSLRITYESPRKMNNAYQSMVTSCIQIRRNGSTPGLKFTKMIPYRCKEMKAAFTSYGMHLKRQGVIRAFELVMRDGNLRLQVTRMNGQRETVTPPNEDEQMDQEQPQQAPQQQQEDRNSEDNCTICLTSLRTGLIAKTVCSHVFHVRCIRTWNSGTGLRCPTCNISPNITRTDLTCDNCLRQSEDNFDAREMRLSRKCGHLHLRSCQEEYLATLPQRFPHVPDQFSQLCSSMYAGCRQCAAPQDNFVGRDYGAVLAHRVIRGRNVTVQSYMPPGEVPNTVEN